MHFTREQYGLGKIAYDAYCKASGGKSLISGEKLPSFEHLKQEIKDAWASAALAVKAHGSGVSAQDETGGGTGGEGGGPP